MPSFVQQIWNSVQGLPPGVLGGGVLFAVAALGVAARRSARSRSGRSVSAAPRPRPRSVVVDITPRLDRQPRRPGGDPAVSRVPLLRLDGSDGHDGSGGDGRNHGARGDAQSKTTAKGGDASGRSGHQGSSFAHATGDAADTVLGWVRDLCEQPDVAHLARRIVEIAGENFGLARVVLRLYNPRTRLYEPRAFFHCDPDLVERISTIDVTGDQYEEMTRRALDHHGVFRVPEHDPLWPDRLDGESSAFDRVVDGLEARPHAGLDAPGPGDHLVVPLPGEGASTVGYLVASVGEGLDFPGEEDLQGLSTFARIAVHGLRTARLRSQVERRELEYSIVVEQLKEWQGLRDNFVANVSHELRTPLTSIKAYAETLERSFDRLDAETAREFVRVILHEGERLDQVFDDLIGIAHLDNQAPHPVRDRVDLRALVLTVAEEQRGVFAEKGLRLATIEPQAPLFVQGDAGALRQILDALLSNALKFTPEGGNVTIRLSEEVGTARMVVEDTGIGIPEQDLGRVFERFYQVDGSSTRAFGGQGLGLALCKQLVRWHHGSVYAENRRQGGARFVVELPVRGLVVRQAVGDAARDGGERMQWEAFLQLSVSLVSEMLRTRVVSIMLVDEPAGLLRIEAAVGLEEEVVQSSALQSGEGVAGRVWRDGETIFVPDLDADERFRGLADDVTYQPRSLLSVPLVIEGEVIGVLNVNSKFDGQPFDEDDRILLEALAERLVHALDSFERFRTGYRRLVAVENGVRAMLDVRRDRNSVLREFLVHCGTETARRLGLEPEQQRALAYALRTYDLGLSQVNRRILSKSEPLTSEERRRIEEHVIHGAEMVAELEPSPVVRRIILHHHENFDGTGYPDGLRGEAIPVGARIVRVFDALVALLHDRPFRPALDLEAALGLLSKGMGRHFCPRVTERFLEVVLERESSLRELLRRAPQGEVVLGSDPSRSHPAPR